MIKPENKNTIKPTFTAAPKLQPGGEPQIAKPKTPLDDDDDFEESLDDIDYENLDFDEEDDY